MPKQKRWTIKRELEQADGHVDAAITQLVITGYQYEEAHFEYYEVFTGIIALLTLVKTELNSLKDRI